MPLVVAGAANIVASLGVTVVLARVVGESDYGSVIQLLALFQTVAIAGNATLVAVVRRLAPGPDQQERIRWLNRLYRIAWMSEAGWVLIIFAARGFVAHALASPNPAAVVAMLGAAGVFFVLCVDRGAIQARQRYGVLAVNVVLEGGVRFVATVGLPLLGFGVPGVAAGMLIAQAAGVVHARFALARITPDTPASEHTQVPDATSGVQPGRSLLSESAMAFACFSTITLLQNLDIIELGSRAHANAGAYAAVSVPSKALIFWALFFANYLIPETTIRSHRGEQALRPLLHTLAIVVAPAMLLLAIAVVAPSQLLTLVFRQQSSTAAHALLPLAAAMTLLSITVVLMSYMLALGHRRIIVILTSGVITLAATSYAAAGAISATAINDLVVQALLTIAMVIAVVTLTRAEVPTRSDRDRTAAPPGVL